MDLRRSGFLSEPRQNPLKNGLSGKTVLSTQEAGIYPGSSRAQMSVAASGFGPTVVAVDAETPTGRLQC